MSEDKDIDATPAPEEKQAEVVKAPENRVEVSADLLNEAVGQLRKMAEIRLRDSERQERAISQMQKTLKRGRILSRYVIFSCLVVMLVSVGLAYLMWQSASSEKTTATTLIEVNDSLQDATKTIAAETQKQVSSLDNIRVDVVKAREEQARIASDLEQELKATREIQAAVVEKVEEQLGAVRGERDQITGEVRSLLEEKTEFYLAKERELEAERDAIKDAKERSKEEQKELINDTIARLNAMAASLEGGEVITVSEVEEAVSAAEEAIAEGEIIEEITEEAVIEAVEETVEEAAPEEADAPEEAVEETVETTEEPAAEEPAEETAESAETAE